MAPSEHALQKAYFDWARMHPLARRAYAIPNGGQRHIVVAAKLKAEGCRAGVLDACVPVMASGCGALYIEFKAGKNTLSPQQKLEAQALVGSGYCVAVCWSTESAIRITEQYLKGQAGPALFVRP